MWRENSGISEHKFSTSPVSIRVLLCFRLASPWVQENQKRRQQQQLITLKREKPTLYLGPASERKSRREGEGKWRRLSLLWEEEGENETSDKHPPKKANWHQRRREGGGGGGVLKWRRRNRYGANLHDYRSRGVEDWSFAALEKSWKWQRVWEEGSFFCWLRSAGHKLLSCFVNTSGKDIVRA